MIKDVFLDLSYEFKLIKLIIGVKTENANGDINIDSRFGRKVIEMLDDRFFSSSFSKHAIRIIRAYHDKYRNIPKYSEILLESQMLPLSSTEKNELKKFLIDTVFNQKIDNYPFLEDKFNNFLIQQTILNFCQKTEEKIVSGDTSYETIDQLMSELRVLHKKMQQMSRPVELTEDISFLKENEGYFVPLGWGDDFDKTVNFRQGSMFLNIVPTGVGKTTSAVVTAVHNFLLGKNVLLLFFEDDYSDIFKKIYAKLSGFHMGDFKNNFDIITDEGISQIKTAREGGGNLVLLKLSQIHTNTNHIRNHIDYFISTYGSLDLLVLDYLDCIKSPSNRKYDSKYEEQDDVMIDVLEMGSDLEYFIPILTYIQSGRAGLNKAIIDASNSGGSLGRALKSPQLATISKTASQKSAGTANILIEKNRKGMSGIFYRDVEFDNGRVHINITTAHIEEIQDLTS